MRTAADLDAVDGLIIPGGESTTMLKLLNAEKLMEPLRQFGLEFLSLAIHARQHSACKKADCG